MGVYLVQGGCTWSRGGVPGWGVPGPGGVPGRGVYLVPGGCTWSWGGCTWSGGTWSRGGVPGWGGVPGPGGGAPGLGGYLVWGGAPGPGGYLVGGHLVRYPPCGQTHTCKNITFANYVCGR